MYNFVQIWLASDKYGLKAPHAMTPRYITIHNTANDASARNEIAYMLRNTNATSYHVAIDDIEVIQAIPFTRNAWHAGDGGSGTGNRKSVGIEICYSKSGGARYLKAEKNAIEYTARLLILLGLTPDRVKYHQEWSGKHCPHRILSEGRGVAVKKAISARYAELVAPKPTSVAPNTTASKLWRVFNAQGQQVGAFTVEANALALQKQHAGSTIKYYENGKEVVKQPVKPSVVQLWRVFDRNNKQVGAYSVGKNAHDEAIRIGGVVREYRDGKLYATKSYVKDIREVTATQLNVRRGSGAGHPIVGSLRKGDKVEVKKDMGNGWVEIVKPQGYVNKSFLK